MFFISYDNILTNNTTFVDYQGKQRTANIENKSLILNNS